MPQVINTNVAALNAQRHLNQTNNGLSTALERLSSGYRINSAKDDAAGQAIAERFTSQIRGFNQGIRNAGDAISLTQTAESVLNEIINNVQRMRELAIQSSNGTNSATDRLSLNQEVTDLASEIARIVGTEFNGVQVVGGGAGANTFQVGADAGDNITITTIDTTGLSAYASLVTNGNVSTAGSASTLVAASDVFLAAVNSERGKLGAAQNRFEAVIRNSQSIAENLSASRSRIQDADFAAETAEMTRLQILQQAGISILGQANAAPQQVLSLLQG